MILILLLLLLLPRLISDAQLKYLLYLNKLLFMFIISL